MHLILSCNAFFIFPTKGGDQGYPDLKCNDDDDDSRVNKCLVNQTFRAVSCFYFFPVL